MKNPFKRIKKRDVQHGIAKGVSSILGGAHFTYKTLADITAYTEAGAVFRLTGKSRKATIEDRHNKTEDEQERIIKAYNSAKDSVNSKLDKLAHRIHNDAMANEQEVFSQN